MLKSSCYVYIDFFNAVSCLIIPVNGFMVYVYLVMDLFINVMGGGCGEKGGVNAKRVDDVPILEVIVHFAPC